MKGFCSLKKVMIWPLSTLKIQKRKFSVSDYFLKDISKNNNKSSEGAKDKPLKITETNHLPYIIPEKDKELVNELKKGIIWYPYKSPKERIYDIVKKDMKVTGRKIVKGITNVQLGDLEIKYFPRHTDILVIGSGALGHLLAYALRSEYPYGSEILVVGKDTSFPLVSTNLAQATLSPQQFTVEEEILMSQYCAQFLSTFHRHTEIDGHPPFTVSYEPLGSLCLAKEDNIVKLLENNKLLEKNNLPTYLLRGDELKKFFPWLNGNDIELGCMGLFSEGVFDPWAFMIGLKSKAINMGVTFTTAEVLDFGMEDGSPRRAICRLPDGTYNSIDFGLCIVAAGMESLRLLEMLNSYDQSVRLKLPLEERMRYEFCFFSSNGPGINTPIVIDPDGLYFRREGVTGHYVAGIPSVLYNTNEEYKISNVFEEKIKPFLINRVPEFENLELTNGWINKYEFCLANEVGILGFHPFYNNVMFVTGFSHKGLQLLPAVARALVELVYDGEFKTIDFTAFNFENLYRKRKEKNKQEKQYLESQNQKAISEN